MAVLSIDFESRSTLPLNKTGVYPYAAHPTTDILCMAYAFDDEPVELWTPEAQSWEPSPDSDWFLLNGPIKSLFIPERVVQHIISGGEVRAWNAQFERIMWNEIMAKRYGFPPLTIEQTFDTAADAAALALPRALGKAAVVLGLDVEKDMEGRKLMLKMCKPRKIKAWRVTCVNGCTDGPYVKSQAPKTCQVWGCGADIDPEGFYESGLKTVIWWDTPEMRHDLGEYCKRDVEVERAVGKRIRKLPAAEREVYVLDQRMNDRGVMIDVPLVHAAEEIVAEGVYRANIELAEVTSGEVGSVTKVADLTRWLQYQGLDIDNVRKDTLRDALAGDDLPEDVRAAMVIRTEAGKTSNAKLASMLHASCDDGRARGLLLYHGAGPGRWSGKLIQPQNFPRPSVKDIESYIPWVMDGLYDVIDMEHPPTVVVSSMLRSMLRAAPGHRFMAGDYSQIEARVLAWLAEQEDLVELFARGGKVYEEMAAFIYGMLVEEIENPSEERQVGKNSILGGGFQMGWERFQAQVKEQTGIEISDEDAKKAINGYRTKNFKIKAFWPAINQAAMEAVRNPGKVTTVGRNGCIRYVVRGQFLWCQLPSKRFLAYAKPDIREKTVPWGGTRPALTYMGVDSTTRRWRRHSTYGGHLTENVVQATARDIMVHGLMNLEREGYRPLLTVHDEVICETPDGHGSVAELEQLMIDPPAWADGLPTAAEGWEGARYRK